MKLLGEILVDLGYCTVEEVEATLGKQREGRGLLSGELLMEMGAVTEEQVVEALRRQMFEGDDLPDIPPRIIYLGAPVSEVDTTVRPAETTD